MVYVALIVTVLFLTGQNIVKKKYEQISSSGVCFFSGMVSLFAMLMFAAVNRNWSFEAGLLFPAFLFGVSYACATVGFLLSIKYGSLANSSLVLAYSLLIPTVYGLIFLDEPIGVTLIIGLFLVALSLWLINHQKTGERITWKWVVFVLIGFFGNGMCSAVQKAAAISYGDEKINLIMVLALGMSSAMMFVASPLMREREIASVTVKKGLYLALACGLMNGVCNLLVIFMNTRLPASVMFPVLSGGNLVTVFLYSVLVLKERFSVKQYVGFFAGVVSVVILNL